MKFTLNTDGASRGNPGPASYGYIICGEGGIILHQEGKFIGETTNNVAEYMAVKEAFAYICRTWKGLHEITLQADSLLVIQQLKGVYKIKKEHLAEIYRDIKVMEAKLGTVNYTHVPRARNFIADRLANQALDSQANTQR